MSTMLFKNIILLARHVHDYTSSSSLQSQHTTSIWYGAHGGDGDDDGDDDDIGSGNDGDLWMCDNISHSWDYLIN